MKTLKTDFNLNPKYNLGDLVVIKSYSSENPITGDPLSVPPIMVVSGIEIENSKKKTHDNNHGEQIAERIKYKLVWFDAKKSAFIEKIMYQSFLKKYSSSSDTDKKSTAEISHFKYEYGEIAQFKTLAFEIELKKKSVSESETKSYKNNSKKADVFLKITENTTPLLPFVSPDFVMTSMRLNEEKDRFDDKGNATVIVPKRLVKVMWYNAQQQKYSEYEIAENCLLSK